MQSSVKYSYIKYFKATVKEMIDHQTGETR